LTKKSGRRGAARRFDFACPTRLTGLHSGAATAAGRRLMSRLGRLAAPARLVLGFGRFCLGLVLFLLPPLGAGLRLELFPRRPLAPLLFLSLRGLARLEVGGLAGGTQARADAQDVGVAPVALAVPRRDGLEQLRRDRGLGDEPRHVAACGEVALLAERDHAL